jgi:hypothetical protein
MPLCQTASVEYGNEGRCRCCSTSWNWNYYSEIWGRYSTHDSKSKIESFGQDGCKLFNFYHQVLRRRGGAEEAPLLPSSTTALARFAAGCSASLFSPFIIKGAASGILILSLNGTTHVKRSGLVLNELGISKCTFISVP